MKSGVNGYVCVWVLSTSDQYGMYVREGGGGAVLSGKGGGTLYEKGGGGLQPPNPSPPSSRSTTEGEGAPCAQSAGAFNALIYLCTKNSYMLYRNKTLIT